MNGVIYGADTGFPGIIRIHLIAAKGRSDDLVQIHEPRGEHESVGGKLYCLLDRK